MSGISEVIWLLSAFLQSMKQTRVRLMRQLKEESERYRQAKRKSDREVRVLKLREQQRTAQMARLERESNLKLSVLRRRMEEAQAAKQRLAASLERRHERRPAGAAHQQGMGTRIKVRDTRQCRSPLISVLGFSMI